MPSPFYSIFTSLFFGGGWLVEVLFHSKYLNVLYWLVIWRFKSKVTCPGSRDWGSNWGWQHRDQPGARAQVPPVCSPLLIDSRVQMWLLSTRSLLLNTVSVWDVLVCPVLHKVCSESLFRVNQEEGGANEGFNSFSFSCDWLFFFFWLNYCRFLLKCKFWNVDSYGS